VKRSAWRGLAFALALAAAAASAQAAVPPIPDLRIDLREVTVSGLSSGGYMAAQLHVAHSSLFRGAGVIAAGPWGCALGVQQPTEALVARCLRGTAEAPVATLQATARQLEAAGLIDPLDNLKRSRLYLFSGRQDSVVRPAVSAALARFYAPFVPAAATVADTATDAGHAMVTADFGNACGTNGMPFVQDCDHDLAGRLLAHLHAPAAWNPPAPGGLLRGRFLAFDQGPFQVFGLGREGRLYVPPDCGPNRPGCRLHVVLHGCGQNVNDLGETYVQRTGYAQQADANRLVLLFPQTGPQAKDSCWDWTGYTSLAAWLHRDAPQMRAIRRMVEALAGAPPACHRAFNGMHLAAGRATFAGWGALRAKGSAAWLGMPWVFTTLREGPPGYFAPEAC
jgi:poly(3-hydroxybutyrate) depolymerase